MLDIAEDAVNVMPQSSEVSFRSDGGVAAKPSVPLVFLNELDLETVVFSPCQDVRNGVILRTGDDVILTC